MKITSEEFWLENFVVPQELGDQGSWQPVVSLTAHTFVSGCLFKQGGCVANLLKGRNGRGKEEHALKGIGRALDLEPKETSAALNLSGPPTKAHP